MKKLFIALFCLTTAISYAQMDPRFQLYRDDAKGDPQYIKEGVMDGNLVRTLFINNGMVAHWPNQPSGEWSKGSAHTYLDGVGLLIGAKITAPGNGRIVTPIESAYREEVDFDPVTQEQWVLQPVPGYVRPDASRAAVNIDTSTFPVVWPAALGLTPDWNGLWYGYFGRGITNADFETFFVVDDSKDKEYNRLPFGYYPLVSDSARGGLGLRIEVRGFQWSHVLAEDIIFWHYDIVNISDRDYDTTCFGFFTDPGVGGQSGIGQNNSAYFDTRLDLAYAWNEGGKGTVGFWKTGYMGYAYLESPGNPWDGIDNDEDATKLDGSNWRNGSAFNQSMIDERRDDNIDNDEDWIPFADLNGNGKWDPTEPLNDDLGRDGVGPDDAQYNGPDQGEGDGLPTHGEPNFDETDKDESDQIGLTAVSVLVLSDKGPTAAWPKNDDVEWEKMNGGFKDTLVQNSNITMIFASGPFPLKQGKRERFSMALAFGEDLNDLIFNKETVQQIYNANYNFSKPPDKPSLTAVPGDKKVYLYWDDRAERSIDRFMGWQDPNDKSKGYKRDFEGYCIYRSTEPQFNDVKLITDSRGSAKYYKPIAQFDLVDSIFGPDPVGINGARFWRGSETGLQHSFRDTTVTNGVRYYYAVVSYDQGDPKRGTTGLQPTECLKNIDEDFAGNIKFVDINCAVVTPNAPAAGYFGPTTEGNLTKVTQGLGSGQLQLTVLNPSQVQEGDRYVVKFRSDSLIPKYTTLSCNIMRTRASVTDTLVHAFSEFGTDKASPVFDGMSIVVMNDSAVALNPMLTDWVVGPSNFPLIVSPDLRTPSLPWPADYEIRWGDSSTTAFPGGILFPTMRVGFTIWQKDTTSDWVQAKFIIHDADTSKTLTPGDTIRIIEKVVSSRDFKFSWKVAYGNRFAPPGQEPQPGNRFVIGTLRPFLTGDFFTFTTHASRTNLDSAKNQLSKITVVPNPYISTAKWESRTLFTTGRGSRRIEFKKLPAKCTIRIYTVTGVLVKTLFKDSSPQDGSLSWDLLSDDGMDIAYGLYIFHVDAPDIGEYIGKFAVVK
jgi:hypothetical protein